MKRTYILILTIAVALYCAPAFAQHGHGMGGPGGMGMNGMGPSTHASANTNPKAGDLSGSTASHGKSIDQLLTQNARLAAKISTLAGEPAQQACSGFKNLGQCVAAAHVSKNLKITFDCLKSDMTGTAPSDSSSCPAGTGSKSMSLGKSIQSLSPNSNSKSESQKGQEQADQDLKDSTKNS